MDITKEEKIMYEVMCAIFDSGIPIDFKGSMVLKACLLESGYLGEIRHTVDIDGNWYSDNFPTMEQLRASIQLAIDKKNIGLKVQCFREYGKGRSAGFELTDANTGETIFSMDIDVNRPVISSRIYEIEGMKFRGVSPVQMISDKVRAVSTEKVFRRIKDVVDLYYLSTVFEFDKELVLQTLKDSERTLDTFDGFLNRTDDLKHAYEKFRFAGGIEKPPFETVYNAVKVYIKAVL